MQEQKSPEESRKALDRIFKDLTRSITRHDELSRFWLFLLTMFAIVGVWGFIIQFQRGLGVTGMRDYVSWAMYIGNFVFFVAVSLVGFLISSTLHLLNYHWTRPISRVAEQVAIAAVAMAGLIILMDMGRPDRFLNVVLHGRFASPILWDATVIFSYLVISLLLFYLPLLPDLALLRDRLTGIPPIQRKLYGLLSMGWKGNAEQFRILAHAMRVMMILIIPVGLSIHTVTSWLFAVTLRAGWDTTIFGPYFVSGAFVVGTAAVIVVMYIYRGRYRLKNYFTDYQFDNMGKLLVFVCLVYLYFNLNEFLVPGYKMKLAEGIHIRELFRGGHSGMFWFVQLGGIVLPIILLFIRFFRKPLPIFLISLLVVMASWFKRFVIVVPTMEHPHLPIQNVPEYFKHYAPTSNEIVITLFPFMLALLIITILAKLFPVISIWEYAEDKGIEKKYLLEKPENQN